MKHEILLDRENIKFVPANMAWFYQILPAGFDNGILSLFVRNSFTSSESRHELETILGFPLLFITRSDEEIEKALAIYYRKDEAKKGAPSEVPRDVSSKDFVSELIREAKSLKSSDIHIEAYDQKCRIRFRIDGRLVERLSISKVEYPALVNRIKILANLDIAERRLPQDGRIFHQDKDNKFDIRVSVLPTLYGEKIVLRILGGSSTNVELRTLGFTQVDLERFQESIRKPNGIILISGPTGSGKTTTLYATLKILNKETDNILTVEDPIEYTLDGINQVQVKEDIGLNFSRTLRTFLRQDPDIIMVGEIRDAETANLAIRAALTGHLVLSTIHTNSAWGTVSRLIDMGIPPFLIASTINSTIAQRLIRILCPHCKEHRTITPELFPRAFKKWNVIVNSYKAVGCKECFFTGYKGRRAIYEVIPVDSQVSDFIVNNTKAVDAYFKSIGVKTLQDCALDILKNGETSVEEIYPLLLDEQY